MPTAIICTVEEARLMELISEDYQASQERRSNSAAATSSSSSSSSTTTNHKNAFDSSDPRPPPPSRSTINKNRQNHDEESGERGTTDNKNPLLLATPASVLLVVPSSSPPSKKRKTENESTNLFDDHGFPVITHPQARRFGYHESELALVVPNKTSSSSSQSQMEHENPSLASVNSPFLLSKNDSSNSGENHHHQQDGHHTLYIASGISPYTNTSFASCTTSRSPLVLQETLSANNEFARNMTPPPPSTTTTTKWSVSSSTEEITSSNADTKEQCINKNGFNQQQTPVQHHLVSLCSPIQKHRENFFCFPDKSNTSTSTSMQQYQNKIQLSSSSGASRSNTTSTQIKVDKYQQLHNKKQPPGSVPPATSSFTCSNSRTSHPQQFYTGFGAHSNVMRNQAMMPSTTNLSDYQFIQYILAKKQSKEIAGAGNISFPNAQYPWIMSPTQQTSPLSPVVGPKRIFLRSIITPYQRELVSKLTTDVLSQLEITYKTEADTRKRNRIAPLGFKGLSCIHCRDRKVANNPGRYFPSSAKILANQTTLFSMHKHLQSCQSVPNEIKLHLATVLEEHLEEKKKVKKNSRCFGVTASFFGVIWEFIHGKKDDNNALT